MEQGADFSVPGQELGVCLENQRIVGSGVLCDVERVAGILFVIRGPDPGARRVWLRDLSESA